MPRGIRLTLPALAVLFTAFTLVYTYFWMDAVWLSSAPSVELGIDFPYQDSKQAYVVTNVRVRSPAERCGLRVGDEVIALDGQRTDRSNVQLVVYKRHSPGDAIRLNVRRSGTRDPLELVCVFQPNSDPLERATLGDLSTRVLESVLVLAFATVGLVVLLLRPADRNVWLLAGFFAGVISLFGFRDEFTRVPAGLRPWLEGYRAFFQALNGVFFYWLCAVFPAHSPLERRLPRLKWVAVVLSLCVLAEMRYPDLPLHLQVFSALLSPRNTGFVAFGIVWSSWALGFVSLAGNYLFAVEPETRRKIRVIFWGTMVGLAPGTVRVAVEQYTSLQTPFWLSMMQVAALLLVPMSFAYAVFMQRVLDIPILLRRSARYLLVQRGFVLLLCGCSFALTLLFADAISRLSIVEGAGRSTTVALGAAFGTVLVWAGWRVHAHVSRVVDRAFFRSAFDERVVLERLAESSLTTTSREELADLLRSQLDAALRPASLAIYVAEGGGILRPAAAMACEVAPIEATMPEVVELTRRAGSQDVPVGDLWPGHLRGGCLAPMLGRDARLLGVIALGPRLSDEPYSAEDKRLLASVAGQAAVALDNFRLAEDIAEKLEAERRSAREMEIAKEVQARLLPQTGPDLKTLECSGRCLQARRVGGDYYDFLDVGPNQAGLTLADVSGKGVHAALLVANLQAYLRSLCRTGSIGNGRMTADLLVERLSDVNRTMWKSTAVEHFATLFIGVYDDDAMRLTYVNCGHNAPILLRSDGTLERLDCTATVIGAFEQWGCEACEVQIGSRDMLAIFSDGVTEAMRGEEEFGEGRLLEVLRAADGNPSGQVVNAVFRAVQHFSAGDQSDDLTLVIARGRGLGE